jgi:hypothetical protein
MSTAIRTTITQTTHADSLNEALEIMRTLISGGSGEGVHIHIEPYTVLAGTRSGFSERFTVSVTHDDVPES